MNRKKISLLLALTMLVVSLLGGCGANPAEDSNLENGVPEKEGYVLDFSTEFNDGKLDEEYWLAQYLPHCTTNTAGSSARYQVEDGCLNLYITKDSPDYFGGQPGSVDPDNLLWIANGIQTWEKNNLHPGGAQQMEVEPFEGYATQYGYFEIRMKMPDDNPGVFHPKVHAWDDPNLNEWSSEVNLKGFSKNYVDEFHTYAMDWRPEGITFYVDGKEVAQTEESPQYRMCMILSMYINSDFSGWDEPENKYPIEWLIDYVRVYKDINGYK